MRPDQRGNAVLLNDTIDPWEMIPSHYAGVEKTPGDLEGKDLRPPVDQLKALQVHGDLYLISLAPDFVHLRAYEFLDSMAPTFELSALKLWVVMAC